MQQCNTSVNMLHLESSIDNKESLMNHKTLNKTTQPEFAADRKAEPLIDKKQTTSPKSEVKDTKRRKPKRPIDNRKLKFFIKFKLGKKQYEINFKYDMDRDNP